MNELLQQQYDPDLNYNDILDLSDNFSCRYYTVDTFQQSLSDNIKQTLSVLSFNIRSFNKNSDEFLGFLDSINHDFDILILTETWGKDDTQSLCNIPGYIATHNHREGKRGGGVSIYVRDLFSFEILDAVNISNPTIESAGIKLSLPNSRLKINILGIYRQPNGDKETFLDRLEDIINTNHFSSNDTLITGDLNICLLKEEHCDFTLRFMNSLRSLNFHSLINRPTRIDKRNNHLSIIDHMWTNSELILDRGIFIADITDHFPVFCSLSIPQASKLEFIKIKFRDMNKANEDKFHNLLGNLDWENLIDESLDPHQSTLFFDTKIKNLFNSCFPIKTKLITTKLLNSPWLSSALLKSIKNKHVLYRRLTRRAFTPAALINFKNF